MCVNCKVTDLEGNYRQYILVRPSCIFYFLIVDKNWTEHVHLAFHFDPVGRPLKFFSWTGLSHLLIWLWWQWAVSTSSVQGTSWTWIVLHQRHAFSSVNYRLPCQSVACRVRWSCDSAHSTLAWKACISCCWSLLMSSRPVNIQMQGVDSRVTSSPTRSQFPLQLLTTNIYDWACLNVVGRPFIDSCHVMALFKSSQHCCVCICA